MTSLPPRPTGTTNELAKERNRGAAERTMTAWIQSCLILVSFGVAFDQLVPVWNQAMGRPSPLISDRLTAMVAIVFIGFGIGLLVIALLQYRRVIRALEHEDSSLQPMSGLNRMALGAVITFGGLCVVIVLLSR